MTVTKKSVCPHDCPDCCGLLVEVEGGRVIAVKGDPEHPFTDGFICHKVSSYPARIHASERLTHPLIRTGPKGSGSFRTATWKEALDLVEQKMREVAVEYGAQAILPYSYAGHMGLVHRNAGHAFFHKLGASLLMRTICGAAAQAGFEASLGAGSSTDPESAVDSDFIIIWGSNTLTTNLHLWPIIKKARAKGARLVVIDPYRNATAKQADLHVMPKPGTDAALALGMMHVLVAEELVDREFLARHALGFEEFRQVAAEYTPQKAEGICGVPAEIIRALALDYGKARAPFIRTGWGPARHLKGGMALRTIALLPALVGAFNKKGGGILRSLSGFKANLFPLMRPDLIPAGTRAVNMVELGRALTGLDDPPIKLLYVYVANPAVIAPDSSKVLAGLAREDLFTVVHEMILTDSALMADVVLPATSSLEMTDLYTAYGHHYLQMARPVIPPIGQSRSLLSVFQELAIRFGFDEEVFKADEEEIIHWLIPEGSEASLGIDFETLSSLGPLRLKVPANPYAKGFNTPSGKVEFVSQSLADKGLSALPDGSPSIDPEGEGRFPLNLITPPNRNFLNSTFYEVPALREKAGPAFALVNPGDAGRRGISDGETVRIFNARGECRVLAKLTEDTPAGLVVLEGLFWPRAAADGRGANQLTSQRLTDMGETCAFHTNLVEMEPVQSR